MRRAIVVEHTPADAQRICSLLQQSGFDVTVVASGNEALALSQKQAPDLVVTDLPHGEDGREDTQTLAFVRWLRQHHRRVPIVLTLSRQEEPGVLQAMQTGAVTFIRKRMIEQDLPLTLRNTYELLRQLPGSRRAQRSLVRAEFHYEIDNDSSLVPALLGSIEEQLITSGLFDFSEITRMVIALQEALDNAIFHGNLEVSSALRDAGDTRSYFELAEQRRKRSPYRERHVQFSMRLVQDEVTFVVRDQGPGFNPKSLPDPTDAGNLERLSGRGLLLIRSFFDEVAHNSQGNELRLTKRRTQAVEPEADELPDGKCEPSTVLN